MLILTSPPLKEVRELAQRSMCEGGMLIGKLANRQIDYLVSSNRIFFAFFSAS